MEIKVDFYARSSESHPNLRGFANLTVGGIKIDNVAITETDVGMGKKRINWQVPSRPVENNEGKTIYIPCFEIKGSEEKSQDAGKIISSIRGTIEEAMKAEPNEFKAQSATKEVEVEYDQEKVTSYTNPVQSDNNPNLRAFASIYVGSILRINNVALTEYEKDGQSQAGLNFMSRQVQNKEGNQEYKEQVYPIVKGMREKMKEATVNSYFYEMKQQEKQNVKQKSEGEEM